MAEPISGSMGELLDGLPLLFNHVFPLGESISCAGDAHANAGDARYSGEQIMALCIHEAYKYRAYVSPNPCVGAAVVIDGRIVSLAAHKVCGGLHAERLAITQALSRLAPQGNAGGVHAHEDAEHAHADDTLPPNAELFITLEPCSTHGRTPPCTDIIASSGVKVVHVAILDPNPLHCGAGIEILRRHDVHVSVGLLKSAAGVLIEPFAKGMATGTPYVFAKVAQTLDGYSVDAFGTSKWITGVDARRHVHGMRRGADAILTGVGSILADDSILDTRLCYESANNGSAMPSLAIRNPSVIVLDTHCRTPINSRLVQRYAESQGSPSQGKLYILTGEPQDAPKVQKLRELSAGRGGSIEVITVRTATDHAHADHADHAHGDHGDHVAGVDLAHAMETIGSLGFNNVMLEAGARLTSAMIHGGYVDALHMFVAPKLIFGGVKSLRGGEANPLGKPLNHATNLTLMHTSRIGEDTLLEYRVGNPKGNPTG